ISSNEEYYIILHVGGHFVKDPYVRYVGWAVIRLKEVPDTISYFELCKIVKIGGHISLGSTFREENDSEVATDEYAGDFATSDGLDNVATASSR
ncbi:hypothetical protein Gotur_001120, partial [Gossypium turneri]